MSLGFALSGVQCVQDLITRPSHPAYTWDPVSLPLDIFYIGDTLAPPVIRLHADGQPVEVGFELSVLSGSGVSVTPEGRLAFVSVGDATVRIQPRSTALLTDTALHFDYPVHVAVPRLLSTGQDSMFSRFDTLDLAVSALSTKNVPIPLPPVTWTILSGSSVTLLGTAGASVQVRAEQDGDAVIQAETDSAVVTRTITVRQRAADVVPTADTITLRALGQTWQLGATVFDLRANEIAGAATTWISLNPGIAAVTQGGLVTAQGDGTTLVIVGSTTGGGSTADTTRVKVLRGRLRADSPTFVSGAASIGQQLPQPFVVQLEDTLGTPLADSGVSVTFEVVSGDGRFGGASSAVVSTDAQGRAGATLTLGMNLDDDSVRARATVSGALLGQPVGFAAQPAQPARLTFEQEPGNTAAGSVIQPAPRVAIRDPFGTIVTTATGSVTLALDAATGTSGAQLLGTTGVSLGGGTATFTNVTPDLVGGGYRLVASAPGIEPDTSVAFDVLAGAPDRLAFVVQPAGATAGQPIVPAIEVAVRDANGNTVTTDANRDITLSVFTIPVGGSGTLNGTPVAATAGGVATFGDVRLANSANGYRLRASATGLASATSDFFNVVGVPDTIFAVAGNNQNALVGTGLADSFAVLVRDASGAPVPGDTVVFRITNNDGNFAGADTVLVVTGGDGRAAALLSFAGSAVGNYAVEARSRSLPAMPVSFDFSLSATDLQLEFVVEPTNTTGAVAIAPAIQVRVRDALGATVTGSSAFITLEIEPTSGTAGASIIGTASVAAQGGVASFDAVAVDSAGAGYRLVAVATGITPDTSAAFTVAVGPAQGLRFVGQPGDVTAGVAFSPSIRVAVVDAGGNTVAGATDQVSVVFVLASVPPGANLRGVAQGPAVDGVATFVGLSVDSAGTGFMLKADAVGLASATSAPFAVSPAPPSRVAFRVQPATVTAGVALAPAVTVVVQDSVGNTVPGAGTFVSLALGTNPTGASLSGTTGVGAVDGVATFANLRVRRAGSGYTLLTTSGLTEDTSVPFDVVPGPESRLAFTVQPTNALPRAVIAPPVVVEVRDSADNVVTGFTAAVSMAITTGTGTDGAVLFGTVPRNAVAGVATFDNLEVDLEGTGYTLTATAGALSGVSAPFSILSAAANRLVFTVQPGAVDAGAAFSPAVEVRIQDGAGITLDRADSVFVEITAGSGTAGATLRGTRRLQAVNGVATFTDLNLNRVGTGYTLTASALPASDLAVATSQAFAVTPGAAARLEFAVEPTSRGAGNVFAPALEVAVRDADSNLVTDAATAVTLEILTGTAGASLAGTNPQTSAAGVATFGDVSIDKVGTGYTLRATAPGLTPDTSATFSITTGALARIVVTPAGSAVVVGGATPQLAAEGRDAGDNPIGSLTFAWSSLNANVATVGPTTGVVSGTSAGQATVAATSGGVTGYALVTVTAGGATPVNLWRNFGIGSPGTQYTGVWGSSPSDVWAVGTGGRTDHYIGSGWVNPSSGTGVSLLGVWGSGPSNVYAVGDGGTVIRWNGSAWSSSGYPYGNSVQDVWGASPADVWVVGSGGVIAHYDGSTWTQQTSGTTEVLWSVWGTSASDVHASGNAGVLLHYDGASWTNVTPAGYVNGVWDLWGTASGEVFAVGGGQDLLTWNGSAWTVGSLGGAGAASPLGIWGSSSADVYVAGSGGGILQGVISGLAASGYQAGSALHDVWGRSGGRVWVAGLNAVVEGVRGATVSLSPVALTYFGATAQLVPVTRDAANNEITGGFGYTWTSTTEAVATVDGSGTVTAVSNGATSVCATVPGGAQGCTTVTVQQVVTSVVVGPSGTISGIAGTLDLAATAFDAGGAPVAGTAFNWGSENDAVATVDGSGVATGVSSGQAALSAEVGGVKGYALVTVTADPTTPVNLWTPVTSPTTEELRSVWCATASACFAVGVGGSVLRWDGTSWTISTTAPPGSSGMYGVWGLGPYDVFAVGSEAGGSTVILRYDGATWTPMTSNSTAALFAVWGSSPTDVLAVGSGGTILHYDGVTWTPQTSPTADALRAIYGTSTADVFAAGDAGAMHRRNTASTWTQLASPAPSTVNGIWGPAVDALRAVSGGNVWGFNGVTWSIGDPIPAWFALWGVSPNEIYAVGAARTIAWYNQSNWQTVTSEAGANYSGVAGTSDGDVWVVGDNGAIVRGVRGATASLSPLTPTLTSLGDTLTLLLDVQTAQTEPLPGVTATWSSSNEAAATVDPATGLVTAGANGTTTITATMTGGLQASTLVTVSQVVASVVVTPAGASLSGGATTTLAAEARDARNNPVASAAIAWSSLNEGIATVDPVSGLVTAVASGQVTIAGSAGGVAGYALVTVSVSTATPVNLWVAMNSGTANALRAAWGSSASDVFAVGELGTIRRYNGTSWNNSGSGTGNALYGLWGSSSDDVYAVGEFNAAVRFNGSAWSPVSTGAPEHLRSVWGSSPTDVFVVGDNGRIRHYDGAGWAETSTGAFVEAVWGASAGDVYAVGSLGTVLHYDGSQWTPVGSGTGANLNAVWGSSPTDVFAVGDNGTIVHYDGTGWSPMTSGVANYLAAVWGTSSSDVYAAGIDGVLLHYDGIAWTPINSGTTAFLLGAWGRSNGDAYLVGDLGTILRGVRGATVSVTPATALLAVGGSLTLTPAVSDASATPIPGVTLTWTSGDDLIATVDAGGTVMGVAPGIVNIIGTAPGGAADTVTVTVAAVASIVVTPAGASLTGAGATTTLSAEARDGSNNVLGGVSFTWSSLNPAVADVNAASGQVTAATSGQVGVTATGGGVTGAAVVTVAIPGTVPVNLWAPVASGTGQALYDVWAANKDAVFAVGEQSVVLRFNGSSWSPIDSGVTARMSTVTGNSATDVHTAGSGVLRRYNGSTWSTPTSGVFAGWLGSWAASTNDVYAVGTFQSGSATSYLGRFNGTSWAEADNVVGPYIRGVWGGSTTNILAVGDGGVLQVWDGSTWIQSTIAGSRLNDVFGVSATDVFAVGDNATIVRSTDGGGNWGPMAAPTVSCCSGGLWGSSSNEVYATGTAAGLLVRFNGATWDTVSTGSGQVLYGVGGTSDGDVWAVGNAGTILRGYRGATVTVTGPTPTFSALGATVDLLAEARDAASNLIGGVAWTWASSNTAVATVDTAGVVTAIGNGNATITATAPGGASDFTTAVVNQAVASVSLMQPGIPLTFPPTAFNLSVTVLDPNGNPVTRAFVLTCTSLNPAVATSENSAGVCFTPGVASGQATIAATVEGVTSYALVTVAKGGLAPVNLWVTESSGTGSTLEAIWGLDTTDIWATASGNLLRRTGGSWSVVDNFAGATGLWGTAADNIWRVSGPLIFQYNGSSWTQRFNGSFDGITFSAIWGSAPNDVFAVGSQLGAPTTIYHYDGATWSQTTPVPNTNSLSGVYGFGPADVFAVGASGTVFHYDGNQWSTFTSPSGGSLTGVWGTSGSDLYVSGNFGVWWYNGSLWTQIVGPTQTREAVWGTSASDVYAAPGLVGTRTVDRWNGSTWTQDSSGTDSGLRAIYGLGGSRVWIVGTSGGIIAGYRGATVTLTPADPIVASTLLLTATARDASNNAISGLTNGSYSWSSSNTGVATVDANGLVTAVAAGAATITATAPGGAAGSTTVTVQ